MVLRIEYVLRLLAIAALCGFAAGICGCKTEEKFGKFTEEQMARFDTQKKMDLPILTGGTVLSVGKETLTADEVITLLEETERSKLPDMSVDIKDLAKNLSLAEFFRRYSTQTGQIVIGKVTSLLLYEKGRVEAGDEVDDRLKKYIEAEKNRFIARHGNDYAKADQALRGERYSSWKDFEDKKKEEMLIQMYLSKRASKREAITYSDLKNYYEANVDSFHVESTIEYEYIDIVPSRLDADQINIDSGESSTQAAVRIGNDFVARLREGADMGELAMEMFPKKYTNKRMVYDKARVDSLIPPYDAFARYAKRMSPGEITDPIESKDHVLVMKLLAYTDGGTKTFQEVREDIRNRLEDIQFAKQRDQIFAEVMGETNIADLEKFVNLCVMQAYEKWSGK